MKKIIIRIGIGLFMLPGMFFDLCFGIAFLMNDGWGNTGHGDPMFEWTAQQFNSAPDPIKPILTLSILLSALPAGVMLIALVLAVAFSFVYVLSGIILSPVNALITGRLKWFTVIST